MQMEQNVYLIVKSSNRHLQPLFILPPEEAFLVNFTINLCETAASSSLLRNVLMKARRVTRWRVCCRNIKGNACVCLHA